ncbi:lysosomal protective protein-like isoform X3 [Dermacentor andersoni]|uniref:lysosomal protective protein-like isoform X3 n=1 Tax=Dermacentor andersoni TaxID=34620 RepID=UPI003B3A4FC9
MLTEIVLVVSALPLLGVAVGPSALEVVNLPGLREPINFRHYSGFLNAAEGRLLHYWFMESQRSPSDDPVLLWMNGGPGCSSLVGVAMELGPFRIDPLGVNLTVNPFSWNKVANVIFLEAPAGVGYSYDPTGNNSTDDYKATEDNYQAILDFFSKFPEFRKNEFYVTGESYAGIFVPLLTQRLLLSNPLGINLKGYVIGNGAVDFELHGKAILFFAYYHGLFGDDLWNEVTSNCCNGSVSKETCDFAWNTNDPACVNPVRVAYEIVLKSGLNVYNLYVPCDIVKEPRELLSRRHPEMTSQYATKQLLIKMLGVQTSSLFETPNCYNQDNLLLYYNRRDVIEALHVEQSPHMWVPCSKTLNYTQQYLTMREVVQQLAESGRLRGLVYHGDVDMACPFLGGDWFVRSLGYEVKCSPQEEERSERKPFFLPVPGVVCEVKISALWTQCSF